MTEICIIDKLLKELGQDPEEHRGEVNIHISATKDGVLTARTKTGGDLIKSLLSVGVCFAGMAENMKMDEDTFTSFCHLFYACTSTVEVPGKGEMH